MKLYMQIHRLYRSCVKELHLVRPQLRADLLQASCQRTEPQQKQPSDQLRCSFLLIRSTYRTERSTAGDRSSEDAVMTPGGPVKGVGIKICPR